MFWKAGFINLVQQILHTPKILRIAKLINNNALISLQENLRQCSKINIGKIVFMCPSADPLASAVASHSSTNNTIFNKMKKLFVLFKLVFANTFANQKK
jgi:hypothetical protein